MRWQPDAPVCDECGFDWRCSWDIATAEVAAVAGATRAALRGVADPTRRSDERWSASMYVWHLVDVLRIGTERLLTLALDPGRGITCWDENALAADRRYERLSPAVGLAMLERAARDWADVAGATPRDAEVRHPIFGVLDALDLVRRNAHEVHHHVQDIGRWAQR